MANPLYGQNKADANIGWLQNSTIKEHGTLAAARTVTTPTAALIVAEMKIKASDGKCVNGDTCKFSFINAGTAGVDETCTMTAGTGVTIVGFADIENPETTHDAFSVGSSLWGIHVTNATSGSEAVSVVRLA